MSLYTNLDDTTIRQIAQRFDIDTIQSWKLLHGGIENTNHLISTNTHKYVLTLCERKTAEETTILANILEHLEQQNYATSRLIKNKSSASVSFYQNKPVLLKSYIEGRIENDFDDELITKLGKKIAKLNQLSPPQNISNQFAYGQQHFPKIYDAIKHPFVDWLKEMHQYILDHLHPSLPKAFIHGDIFTSNVIIAKGKVPIIMDFEEACYYYRIFDLGMAAVGVCAKNGVLNWDKIRKLIQGYKKEMILTDLEIQHFKAFIVYAATATAFWRFRQFNVLVPIAEMKDSYKEMQNLAIQARNKNIDF